jgi:hypothetical protein
MHAQGRRTTIGSRGVLMEAESKIGATALADRHLLAMAGAVPADFQVMSLHTLARVLRLAG